MKEQIYDICIIGAGVIGCLLARELSKYDLSILVLEKNNDVCEETSSANSAIIHSGYDPLPGTLKAKLNVEGNKMFDQICDELDVPFKRVGSITVAFNKEEMKTLNSLHQRGIENKVETILIDKEELHRLEPLLTEKAIGGLLAKTCGIIDPFNLCVHAMENAIDNGVILKLNVQVEKIDNKNFFTLNDQYKSRIIINATGVNADDVNQLVNQKSFTILPRRGEYIVLDHFNAPFVNHTLFMVPSSKGKGVLITPTTSGNYLIGPSANIVIKNDNSTGKEILQEVKNQAGKMINNIPYQETIRTFAGIRATPSTKDFIIEESQTNNFINIAGIESPGLASAPAIVKMVIDEIIAKKIHLKVKNNYNPRIKKYLHLNSMSLEEKQKLFQKNQDYGQIICKCEKISKGEIIDCLKRSCPPLSVKALKKRLRVGFGRCQGGMCQSEVIDILANFYQLEKNQINYDNLNSQILLEKTKEEV